MQDNQTKIEKARGRKIEEERNMDRNPGLLPCPTSVLSGRFSLLRFLLFCSSSIGLLCLSSRVGGPLDMIVGVDPSSQRLAVLCGSPPAVCAMLTAHNSSNISACGNARVLVAIADFNGDNWNDVIYYHLSLLDHKGPSMLVFFGPWVAPGASSTLTLSAQPAFSSYPPITAPSSSCDLSKSLLLDKVSHTRPSDPLAVGDFDGDGVLDLALGRLYITSTNNTYVKAIQFISLFKGMNNGQFQSVEKDLVLTTIELTTNDLLPSKIFPLAAVDLNRDGRSDIVVVLFQSNPSQWGDLDFRSVIHVLLSGTTRWQFAASQSIDPGPFVVSGLLLVRLDSDPFPDLVVLLTNTDENFSFPWVLLGSKDGSGKFTDSVNCVRPQGFLVFGCWTVCFVGVWCC